MRFLLIALLTMLSTALASFHFQSGNFEVEDVMFTNQVDVFGVEQQFASGTLLNSSRTDGYTDVQIFASYFDEDGEQIGEGIGILANQCGKNVPFDYILPPRSNQRFTATVELYEDNGVVDTASFDVTGTRIRPDAMADGEPVEGIIPVTRQEVAGIEWRTVQSEAETDAPTYSVLFGVGCYRDVFTTYAWYEYTLGAGDVVVPVEHPRFDEAVSGDLTARMELQGDFSGEEFEYLYNRSVLAFPPDGGTRIVFQTDDNTLVTAQPDGSFRRIIDAELFLSSLQGYIWLPEERFVAYYYGGYGDGVTYLAASTSGAYFSTPQRFSTPSVTVPGAAPDLSTLVISGQFNDDPTGFYLKPPAADRFDLLFPYEPLPGNNFPAPVWRSFGGVQSEDALYFALPNDEQQARLFCYDRRESRLYDLAPLPLQLGTEDRAYMVISPDYNTLALGANGVNGGLWLLDLEAFDHCTRSTS